MFPWKAPTDPSIGVTHPGTTHFNEENSRRSPKPASAVFPAEAPDILAQRQDTHYNSTEVPNLEKLWTQQRKLLIYATICGVHSVRNAIIKKSTHDKCWRECRGKGTLLHCWWECTLMQPLWKTVWRFLRKLRIELPYDPAVPLLSMHQDKSNPKRHMHPYVHSSTIHNSQDTEAT